MQEEKINEEELNNSESVEIVDDNSSNQKEEEKKPKRLKYILSILFLVALIVTTIIILFTKYDINDIFNTLKGLDIKYIIIGIMLMFVYILFEGLAMKIILRAMGERVSVWDNFVYSAIDYYFCAVTPSATGGQPMVAYYMKKDRVPLTKTTIVLLINTALFKIVLMTFSIIAIIACPEYVFSRPVIIVLFILGFAINIFLVFMCFLGAFNRKGVEKLGNWLIIKLRQLKIIKKPLGARRTLRVKMEEYQEGGRLILKHKGLMVLALGANFIQRISMFAMSFCVYLAFIPVLKEANPDFVQLGFINLFAIQVIIALSVDSLPLPGGVGISEWLYLFLFTFVYGTEMMVASAMMVTRAVSFYIPLIVTMLIFIGKHISVIVKSRKREDIK